jgi:nucleolar complex protein 2
MVKTTKRSRKFNTKTGGAAKVLEKKGMKLAKKGKPSSMKRGGGRGERGEKGTTASSSSTSKEDAEKAEKERQSQDFLNAENLGQLDMDSFFEKAVMGGGGGGGWNDDDEDDDDDIVNGGGSSRGAIDASDEDDDDDNDESSIDSYTSLGSEEEDIEASEKRLKRQLEQLSSKDPEFHKYLKENESSLLEFGSDDDDDDDDDDIDVDQVGGMDEAGEEYIQDEDAMEGLVNDILSDDDDEEINKNKEEKYAMQSHFKKQQKAAENKFLLTPQRLQQLEQGAFATHSIKGLKRIISAFRTACHLSDANQQDKDKGDVDDEYGDEDESGRAGVGKKKKKEFLFTSPVVFDRVMAVCLVQCHEEFHYHLLKDKPDDDDNDDDDEEEEDHDDDENEDAAPKDRPVTLDENKPLHPKKLAKSPRWQALRPLIESFLKSTLHILSEAGKEAKLLQFVLSSLAKYIPYFTAYTKLAKLYLKTFVQLWSAPLDTSEEYNTVRLHAFLRVRQLAITQPYPFIEDCLKLTYLSYAKRSKFGTASNVTSVLPTLTFMGNCIVELYTMDYASAYQHAFVYIRQLALHLRSAMMKQTPESKSVVCCWQYVHCLKLWVAVLCAACGKTKTSASFDGEDGSMNKLGGGLGKDEEANILRSLLFPLTEIIFGVCRLVPTTLFVPLRLHCVRLLQQLAASTETFIPTTSLLMGVIDMKEVGMKPLRDGGKGTKNKAATTVRGLRLPLILKLPKENTLRTMEQLDSVLKETFILLNREVDLYRYSPGFPEFTFTILHRLRKVCICMDVSLL